MPGKTIESLTRASMAAVVAPVAPAIVEHNQNFGQMPWGERGQNGPMAAGWQTGTEQVVGNTGDRGHTSKTRADLVTQRNKAPGINKIEPKPHQPIKLINIGNTGGRDHRVDLHPSLGTEVLRVDDKLLIARAEARLSRDTEREMLGKVSGVVGGLAGVWTEHLPHGSVVQEMLDSLDYVNQSNVGDWLGGVVEEMMDNAERMVGELRLNSQEAKQLPKNLASLNFAELPEELGLDRLHQQLTKSEVKATQKLVVELNEMLLRGETLTPDVAKGMVEPFSAESLPFVMPMLSLSLADTSRRRRNGAATVLLLSILLASCGGVITPEPGVTIVQPVEATEVQGGVVIVEPANTTEAVATVPSYAELVAEAMGGGFDPDSLEPGRAAALEQLRQTFFIREYDTDGDQQLDGPILSELGENTVQWAVDGVTPYLTGKEINDVYGGGTDTALQVSGFRPGEPLVLSVAGANAELEKQGVPANGKYLVVMSPTQAVVTDERSNPVAEVGADGVWRAMEVIATEVPTETPEPTAEPTATPAPTETPEPTQVPGIETEMYGFLPQIMEPLTMEEVRRELENPKYDNTWPLPKFDPTYGAYELRGLLTNHRYAEIDLGEGYIVHLMADLFYRDSNGEIQMILVPLLIQNQEISRSFRTVRSQAADSVLLSGIGLRDIVDNQYQLGGRGSRANARVIFDRGYYKGDSLREYLNGFTVIAPYDFLSPINDLLGVDREEIIAFMRTGDSDVLGTVDGKPILLPSVIWSEELE